jgi:hypothetical protein
MHSAPGLGWRDSLEAMASGFVGKLVGSLTLYFEGNGLVSGVRVQSQGRTSFSTLAVGQLQIGNTQLCDEDATVIATFSGTDFENTLRHGSVLLVDRHI